MKITSDAKLKVASLIESDRLRLSPSDILECTDLIELDSNNYSKTETSQTDWQQGTLNNIQVLPAGDLILTKSGSDFSKIETSQADFSSGVLTNVVATSSGTLELAQYSASGWHLTGWLCRKPISIQNTSSYAHYGEPIRVTITGTSIKSGGADIRIVDNNGAVISHRIVSADDSTKTYVVQFESRTVPANSTVTYYAYYNNPSASSTSVLNKETAYDPFSVTKVGLFRYSFWRNDQYFETYSSNTSYVTSGDDTYGSVTIGFSFPYAQGSSLFTTSAFYVSTNGRAHFATADFASYTSVPLSDTLNNFRCAAWVNSDQVGDARAGAWPASGNLPAGHKFSSYGYDYGGVYRYGSAIFWPSGRVHIITEYGRGTPGFRTGTSDYAYWSYINNSCIVVILDPMSVSVGSEQTQAYYSSGSRESPEYSLSSVGVASSSSISWTATIPSGTGISVESNLTLDGGSTWQGWQTCSNGGSIPGISKGTNLSNAKLKVRQTLSTTNTSITPQLNDLTISVTSGYRQNGSRTTPDLSINLVGRCSSSVISWTATTPSGTSVTIETNLSLDNGSTWQGWQLCTNGGQIPGMAGVELSRAKLRIRQSLSTSDIASTPQLHDLSISVSAEPTVRITSSGQIMCGEIIEV